MNKTNVIVPKGIRYISEWKEFSLPDHPCIINKKITGCGFTEFCITNNENVILCSPRKILLENKEEQHQDSVLYVRNSLELDLGVDKDLTSDSKAVSDPELEAGDDDIRSQVSTIHDSVVKYFTYCFNNSVPCKILVTYDSFHIVKDCLQSLSCLESFHVVVDEFQSVLTDAKFKSSTEIEFLDQLQGITKLCFVSATPLLDEYLDELNEFKDLPYYELDWKTESPSRVSDPVVNLHSCPRGILGPMSEIINKYKSGEFESTTTKVGDSIIKTVSKEAVIYVNSVRNICDIIRKCDLKPDETNVLCAKTPENEKKIRKAFKVGKDVAVLGKVPTKGQAHKMFTLCTRTVYLGADFYSTNARTFIFSDANIDSLTVDIKLDLPQILGRQRLSENPWKNRAELYCKTLKSGGVITKEESDKIVELKTKKTENILASYQDTREGARHDVAEKYLNDVKFSNYKSDYVAVNTRGGKDLVPVFNNLVKINDIRAFRLQQIDYRDISQVFSSLGDSVHGGDTAKDIIDKINEIKYFHNKMRYIYSLNMPDDLAKLVLDNLSDSSFSKYYWTVSQSRASTLNYQKGNLEAEYNAISGSYAVSDIEEEITNKFTVGLKITKSQAKSELQKIYDNLGIGKTAKASDLEEYFELRPCKISNPETGKRDAGFEIIKKK